jgi:hypothetical protein
MPAIDVRATRRCVPNSGNPKPDGAVDGANQSAEPGRGAIEMSL